MRDSERDHRYVGAAAESLVIARLLALGHNAWIPAIDCGADIGVCVNNRLIRIQVKSSSTAGRLGSAGSRRFWLQRSLGNERSAYSTCDEVLEIFALVAMPEQVVFVVPCEDVEGQHSVTIRPDDRRREAWHLIEQHTSLSDDLVRISDSEIKTVEHKERLPIRRSGKSAQDSR